MTLLRMLRNLAVLVVLTVAALSLNPRPVAAQSCQPLGRQCSSSLKCCPGSLCVGSLGYGIRCCNKPYYHQVCTRSDVCCMGTCFFFPGKSYGYCSGGAN
jgi:hypothetical protein